MRKLTLYIPEPLPGGELTIWFKSVPAELLYRENLPPNFFESIERALRPEDAQAIVLPNNFKFTSPDSGVYVQHWADEGERLHVPVYVFSLGDMNEQSAFDPRVQVFRCSVYRSTMRPQDIVMPTLTDDSGKGGISIRQKLEKPQVSFCGMAALPTLRNWTAYHLKNLYFGTRAIFSASWRAHKLGVYWRRKSMNACVNSPLVTTLFIIRKTFSASSATIELDPVKARKDFVDSITGSDFVLAPKGDGNYSNRFLETLSLGRIPVMVDTDAVLPFEDRIDYSKIMVRVPMRDVRNTPRYIRAFYDAVSPEEWEARQRLAREVYERYLRQDSFFNEFFSVLQ